MIEINVWREIGGIFCIILAFACFSMGLWTIIGVIRIRCVKREILAVLWWILMMLLLQAAGRL
jgi:hypothetical protein